MENAGGNSMVGNNAEIIRDFNKATNDTEVKEVPLKWCSVTLSEVLERNKRLEASVFGVEAKKALQIINDCKYDKVSLIGKDGFVSKGHYGGRLKRNYIDSSDENSIGFIGSSEMLDIYPKPTKFMRNDSTVDTLRVKYGTVLISRSGTIGNVIWVNKTLEKFLVSEHAIRLECNEFSGYVYAFLKSKIGRCIVESKIYGAVIQQIEPEHLAIIPVPNPPRETRIKEKIHNLIVRSFELRDESNALIDKATELLINELNLPRLEDFKLDLVDDSKKIQSFNVKLSETSCRLDASYHVPIVDAIIKHLTNNSEEITTIGDSRISKDVVLPSRFKRVYVDEEYGVKFIGGKEVTQLDPSSGKYLSNVAHKKQLEGALGIKPYSILTPARGSLGDVTLPSTHFHNWAISDNMMQILSNREFCGYVYIFLNSEYGKVLIQRFTYGGVVDALEPFHIKEVQLPLLRNKDVQKQINDLALEANNKRYEAYKLEQQALKIIDSEVIYSK